MAIALEETSPSMWAFRVTNGHSLDAPQKAKRKVADEHAIKYRHLTARVMDEGGIGEKPLVVVVVNAP